MQTCLSANSSPYLPKINSEPVIVDLICHPMLCLLQGLSIIKHYQGEWQNPLKPEDVLSCSSHINSRYSPSFTMLPKCYEILQVQSSWYCCYSTGDPNGQSNQYLESTEYGQKIVEPEKCSSVSVNHVAPVTPQNLKTYIKSHLSTSCSIRPTHKLYTSSKVQKMVVDMQRNVLSC